MKISSLVVYSVGFLGFLKGTEGWCGLSSSASLSASSSSSCIATSNRRRSSAAFSRLAAEAGENSAGKKNKESYTDLESIKAELTEYLAYRKEMNADDLAKEYVDYSCAPFRSCMNCSVSTQVQYIACQEPSLTF
jgi:hypothetical protein